METPNPHARFVASVYAGAWRIDASGPVSVEAIDPSGEPVAGELSDAQYTAEGLQFF